MPQLAVAPVLGSASKKRPLDDDVPPAANIPPKHHFPSTNRGQKHNFHAINGTQKHHIHPSNFNQSNASNRRFKRTKNPCIAGQKLPVNRLVEVLDHKSLQDLFQAVISHHPQIAHTVAELAPRPGVAQSVELIKVKANAIRQALPYKCETESDYSYIRVKPYLTEFLHCISDFVLDLLPPVGTTLHDSCVVINVITHMLHELPQFKNKEFQYTHAMAYEQIAHSWLILLQHRDEPEDDPTQANMDRNMEFAKVVEELALLESLESHDERSSGKFATVVEYVRTTMEGIAQMTRAQNSSGSIFSDLITVDYSNYSISARTSH